MPYKAILFDMDGVLIDSFSAWLRVFNLCRKNFNFKPLPKDEFEKNCWAVAWEILLPKYFKGITIEDTREFFRNNASEFVGSIKIMPGVIETIQQLKLPKAIVTNTLNRQAKEMLASLRLLKYFDVIIGGDDVIKGKPDPEMLLKALELLNIKKEEAIFIGDMPIDMETGKRAGIFTIGFKVDGGDKKINDIKEVLEVIKC